eukprot:PhM_4_TR11692/c2_g1_i2/m.23705
MWFCFVLFVLKNDFFVLFFVFRLKKRIKSKNSANQKYSCFLLFVIFGRFLCLKKKHIPQKTIDMCVSLSLLFFVIYAISFYFFFFLRQHRQGVLHVILKRLHPLRTDSTVDHTMVIRRVHGHDLLHLSSSLKNCPILFLFLFLNNLRPQIRCANGQDHRLRRVNNRRKAVNAHAAEVGHGDNATLIFVRQQLVLPRLVRQHFDFLRNLNKAFPLRVKHNRRQETGRRRHGDGHIHAVVLAQRSVFPHAKVRPRRRDIHGGLRHGLDNVVVERDLHVRVLLAEEADHVERGVDTEVRTHEKVRHLQVHGLVQTRGDDAAHVC